MEKHTPEDQLAVSQRILNAKAECALRLLEKITDYVHDAGIPIADFRSMCRSVVSGKLNDPAAAFALANYTHDVAEAMRVQDSALRMMYDDRAHERDPSS